MAINVESGGAAASRDQVRKGAAQAFPIVAVNERGSVTRANAPARRALDAVDSRLEGTNLGAILVGLLTGRGERRRRTSFSFTNPSGALEEVFVVLSEAAQEQPDVTPEVSGQAEALTDSPLKFLDFIAHELRNPIGTIMGLAEILERRGAAIAPEDQRVAIETVRVEAERALLILESMLRLAEARARNGVSLSVVPLHSVARRVIEAHRRRYPQRSISLSGDSPLFARANSMWVDLALTNLIGNAEKYTPPERPIEVVFHHNGSRASILVMDNGEGLSSESYRKVWDIYHRAANPDQTVKGSGIGLALCKELIEGMQGEVWAGPRRSGGSAFALTLPSPCDVEVPHSLGTLISRGTQLREPVQAWD